MLTRAVAAVFLAASLTACTQTGPGGPGPREGVGTLTGAVAGGLIGSQIGGGSGRVVAGALGAVAGGLLGNAIGRSLDEQARQQAYAAEYRALEHGAPGAPVAWRHDDYYGTVTPGPYSERSGYARCREYAHTIYIDGRPETARGVACRQSDGTWAPV
jgi:surface antigen